MIMRNFLILTAILIFSIVIISACTKSHSNKDCDEKQIKEFSAYCAVNKPAPGITIFLSKGTYKSQTIYFRGISCLACSVMPTTYGLNCSGDTIRFANANDVKNVIQIAACP